MTEFVDVIVQNIVGKILGILSESPSGVPQPALAKAVGVSKAYLNIIPGDLEEQGLVYRVRVGTTCIVKASTSVSRGDKRLRMGIVRSSEYLFLGNFVKIVRDSMDIDIDVTVYPSALQVVSDMVRGDLKLASAPLVTEIF